MQCFKWCSPVEYVAAWQPLPLTIAWKPAQDDQYAEVVEEQPAKRGAGTGWAVLMWSGVINWWTHLYTRCAVTSGTWRIREEMEPQSRCVRLHTIWAHMLPVPTEEMSRSWAAADCRSGPASLWSRGGTACPRRWMRCVGRHPLPCRTSGTLRPPCPLSAVKIAGHGADSPPRGAAWCAGDETVSRWSSPLLRGAQLKRRAGRRCHPLKEAFVASVRAGNFNEGCCRVSSPFRGWNPLSRQEKL